MFLASDGSELRVSKMVPELSQTPAKTNWLGPKLGEHNKEVYEDILGFADKSLLELKKRGVV